MSLLGDEVASELDDLCFRLGNAGERIWSIHATPR
jgi:hypothetical protein